MELGLKEGWTWVGRTVGSIEAGVCDRTKHSGQRHAGGWDPLG